MKKIEKVEPYQVLVSQEIISKWNGMVRVWSDPKSAVEGAEVVDKITEPIEVTVVEEQKEMFSAQPQRAKIEYAGGRVGWVLYDALTSRQETLAGGKKSGTRGKGKGVGRRTRAN
jgi:hypothetical protein